MPAPPTRFTPVHPMGLFTPKPPSAPEACPLCGHADWDTHCANSSEVPPTPARPWPTPAKQCGWLRCGVCGLMFELRTGKFYRVRMEAEA